MKAEIVTGSKERLAVAVMESLTAATGLAMADLVLKTANCSLFQANTVCPGKFLLLFGGQLAAVEEAYELVQESYAGELLDAFLLGQISPQLLPGLAGSGASSVPVGQAVGVLETFTAASVIAAADAAVKAAAVEILEIKLAQGMTGKGVAYLTGTVAAVETALAVGAEAISESGSLCASGCLPAPHESLWRSLMG